MRICYPRGSRPAVNSPVDCKSTGTGIHKDRASTDSCQPFLGQHELKAKIYLHNFTETKALWIKLLNVNICINVKVIPSQRRSLPLNQGCKLESNNKKVPQSGTSYLRKIIIIYSSTIQTVTRFCSGVSKGWTESPFASVVIRSAAMPFFLR